MAENHPNDERWSRLDLPLRDWSLIVNSRQAKYVACGEPWLESTVAAVCDAVSRKRGIVTSLGLIQWELTLWAACDAGGHVLLVVPEYDLASIDREELARRFAGSPEKIHVYPFPSASTKQKPKSAWPERDKWCMELADEIVPVSIRKDGNLAGLLEMAREKGKKIDERFRINQAPSKHSPFAERIDRRSLTAWANDPHWMYLTHWTRTFSGPWPDEPECQFFHDLLVPQDDVEPGTLLPRSAFRTLARIVSERRLLGSTFRIRNQHSAVAFTAQNPAEALSHMRYRRRFQRWNIEPYGIAITRERLRQLGAAPVVYETKNHPSPEGIDPVWIQGGASGRVDWSQEAEWRYPGNLDLSLIEPEDALILTLDEWEAREIKTLSPWPVRALRS